MVFTRNERNGVQDLSAADAKRRDDALCLYKTCGMLAQHVCHDADSKRRKFVWWEGPVGRGTGSPFAIVGYEAHLSMFEMDFFIELENELQLKPVYVDQGTMGADSPKTTAIYCTPNILEHFDTLLGALPLATPAGDARSVGFDEPHSPRIGEGLRADRSSSAPRSSNRTQLRIRSGASTSSTTQICPRRRKA